MQHWYPPDDEREHDLDGTGCWCDPELRLGDSELIVIHHAADCREIVAEAEKILKKCNPS